MNMVWHNELGPSVVELHLLYPDWGPRGPALLPTTWKGILLGSTLREARGIRADEAGDWAVTAAIRERAKREYDMAVKSGDFGRNRSWIFCEVYGCNAATRRRVRAGREKTEKSSVGLSVFIRELTERIDRGIASCMRPRLSLEQAQPFIRRYVRPHFYF